MILNFMVAFVGNEQPIIQTRQHMELEIIHLGTGLNAADLCVVGVGIRHIILPFRGEDQGRAKESVHVEVIELEDREGVGELYEIDEGERETGLAARVELQ